MEDDIPECTTIKEFKCEQKTRGYTTEEVSKSHATFNNTRLGLELVPNKFLSCLPLLPSFACSIHATWGPPFSRALYPVFQLLLRIMQDCTEWPVNKCNVRKEVVSKSTPETACRKVIKREI